MPPGRHVRSPASMAALVKIDNCRNCQRSLPWEWVPAVVVNGKSLPGTGIWRTQLLHGHCISCIDVLEAKRENDRRAMLLRKDLIYLLGGLKPYREFTFERFEIHDGNQRAFECCKRFNPAMDNVYLWGPCGVGKTHLAWATARCAFGDGSVTRILRAGQISRRIRMKEPVEEQTIVDSLTQADVLVLDDLGTGTESTFVRQILQELLDERLFKDRAGLIVTSSHSLDSLAERLNSDTIVSRLAGMCRVIEIADEDHRLRT